MQIDVRLQKLSIALLECMRILMDSCQRVKTGVCKGELLCFVKRRKIWNGIIVPVIVFLTLGLLECVKRGVCDKERKHALCDESDRHQGFFGYPKDEDQKGGCYLKPKFLYVERGSGSHPRLKS